MKITTEIVLTSSLPIVEQKMFARSEKYRLFMSKEKDGKTVRYEEGFRFESSAKAVAAKIQAVWLA